MIANIAFANYRSCRASSTGSMRTQLLVATTERWEAALPSGPAQVKNSPPKNLCKYIPAQGCTTVHA